MTRRTSILLTALYVILAGFLAIIWSQPNIEDEVFIHVVPKLACLVSGFLLKFFGMLGKTALPFSLR